MAMGLSLWDPVTGIFWSPTRTTQESHKNWFLKTHQILGRIAFRNVNWLSRWLGISVYHSATLLYNVASNSGVRTRSAEIRHLHDVQPSVIVFFKPTWRIKNMRPLALCQPHWERRSLHRLWGQVSKKEGYSWVTDTDSGNVRW